MRETLQNQKNSVITLNEKEKKVCKISLQRIYKANKIYLFNQTKIHRHLKK